VGITRTEAIAAAAKVYAAALDALDVILVADAEVVDQDHADELRVVVIPQVRDVILV